MRTSVDMRQDSTRCDEGRGSMTMKKTAQQAGRAMPRSCLHLQVLWRWGVVALAVILVVGIGKSGRTFASLVSEAREGSLRHSVTPPPSPTMRVGQAGRALTSRELELLRSIELGEIAHAKELLVAGVSANTKDQQGWTPLMLTALHNHIPLIPVLSAYGADPNAQNVKGTTALMLAANNGHREMVRVLLDRGACVNTKTTGGWTALMYAAWKGHSAIVSDLLQAAADPTLRDSQRWTALMYAAWQGYTEAVQMLLDSQKAQAGNAHERKQARTLADRQGHAAIVHLLEQREKRG